jgi:hypothetical protein
VGSVTVRKLCQVTPKRLTLWSIANGWVLHMSGGTVWLVNAVTRTKDVVTRGHSDLILPWLELGGQRHSSEIVSGDTKETNPMVDC